MSFLLRGFITLMILLLVVTSAFAVELGGTHVIGSGMEFTSFTAAIAAINNESNTITTDAIFLVRNGTYTSPTETFPLTITRSGTASAKIIFRKEFGATVTISSPGTATAGEAIVKLTGADYIEFDGINLLGSSAVEYGFFLQSLSNNGCQNNYFHDLTIDLDRTNPVLTYGVYTLVSSTPTSSAGSNSNNRYINLKVRDCSYGIYLLGNSTTTVANQDVNNEIGSSTSVLNSSSRMVIGGADPNGIGTTTNNAAYGINTVYQNNVYIHDCDVNNVSSSSNIAQGIRASSCRGTGGRVARNRVWQISALSTVTAYGVTAGSVGGGGNDVSILNNMVWDIRSGVNNGTSTGIIGISAGDAGAGTVYVHNNSVYLENASATSTSICLLLSVSTTATANVKNNVLYNNLPASLPRYCLLRSATSGTLNSDYNSLYAPGALNIIGYNSAFYANLAAWQATGRDTHSAYGNPLFVSTSDLHIQTGSNSPASGSGITLTTPTYAVATTDIEGDTRLDPPDMGADEGNFTAVPRVQIQGYGSNGTFAFFHQPINSIYDQTFTITNYGTAASSLNLSALTTPFSYVGATPTTIAAGGTAQFTVRFTSPTFGSSNQTINFNPQGPGCTLLLGSTIVNANVDVTSPAIAPEGSFSFGDVPVNAHLTQQFTLTNSGNAYTDFTFNVTGSAFTVFAPQPAEAAASLPYNFTVTYAPTTGGAATGLLTITTADQRTNHTNYHINLSGTGIAPAVGASQPNSGGQSNPWHPTFLPADEHGGHPTTEITFPANGSNNNPTEVSVSIAPTTTNPAFMLPVQRVWSITPTGGNNGSFNADLVLRFTVAELNGNNPSDLTIVYRNNGSSPWQIFAQHIVATYVDVPGYYEVNLTGVQHFSDWTIGSNAILPVELSSFTATASEGAITLHWRTESERENSHFLIQRWSDDNPAFVQTYSVSSQSSNGMSSTPLNYELRDDRDLVTDRTYHYSLTEVSLDGHTNLLRSLDVRFSSPEAQLITGFALLKAYPNPFNAVAQIEVQLREAGNTKITLHNLNGELVKTLYSGFIPQQSTKRVTFDGHDLASGVYLVQVASQRFTSQRKLVLLK